MIGIVHKYPGKRDKLVVATNWIMYYELLRKCGAPSKIVTLNKVLLV
jgi:hypothetical protein